MWNWKGSRAYVIISCEQILIKDSEGKKRISSRKLNSVDTAPVKATKSHRSSYMGISCLCLVVKRACYIKITHSFNIIIRNIRAAPYHYPDFKFTVLLVTDIKLSVKWMLLMGNQVHPKPYWTLRDFRLLYHQFMCLNRIVKDNVILLVKCSIL